MLACLQSLHDIVRYQRVGGLLAMGIRRNSTDNFPIPKVYIFVVPFLYKYACVNSMRSAEKLLQNGPGDHVKNSIRLVPSVHTCGPVGRRLYM